MMAQRSVYTCQLIIAMRFERTKTLGDQTKIIALRMHRNTGNFCTDWMCGNSALRRPIWTKKVETQFSFKAISFFFGQMALSRFLLQINYFRRAHKCLLRDNVKKY